MLHRKGYNLFCVAKTESSPVFISDGKWEGSNVLNQVRFIRRVIGLFVDYSLR